MAWKNFNSEESYAHGTTSGSVTINAEHEWHTITLGGTTTFTVYGGGSSVLSIILEITNSDSETFSFANTTVQAPGGTIVPTGHAFLVLSTTDGWDTLTVAIAHDNISEV